MRIGFRALADAVTAACRGTVGKAFAGDLEPQGDSGWPLVPGASTEADIVEAFGLPCGSALLATGERHLTYTGFRHSIDGTFIPIVGAFCHPAGQGMSTLVLRLDERGVLEGLTCRP